MCAKLERPMILENVLVRVSSSSSWPCTLMRTRATALEKRKPRNNRNHNRAQQGLIMDFTAADKLMAELEQRRHTP